MPSVLVTGASRGIGRAIALRMAERGWDVSAGVRSEEDGRHLAANDRVTPVLCDITDEAQVAALPDAVGGRLDAVVNNAGIVQSGPIEAVALADLRNQLEVNVVAQAAVTQAVLPLLRESKGRIVFLSSISGRVATPFTGAYNASKFALEGMAAALRMEIRPWGIRVSLVEPGPIDTSMWRDALDVADETEAAMSAQHRALYADQIRGIRKAVARTQKQTIPAAKVASAVEHALTASRPKLRYVVGSAARVQAVLNSALPAPALDAALRKMTTGA